MVNIVISCQPFEISAILIYSQDTLGKNDSLTLVAIICQGYLNGSLEIFECAKLNVDQTHILHWVG